jgi:hypothetical protein
MKHLLLLALLIPFTADAARQGSPFPPEIDKRFDSLENDLSDNEATARKYAKVTYEPALDGGNSASTNALDVVLPAGTVITRAVFYVNTVFAGEGGGVQAGSLAFQCAGTRDLMEYQDIDAMPVKSFFQSEIVGGTFGANGLIASGAPIRIQGLGSSIASACTIKAVVRGSSGDEDLASGSGVLLLEYFNAN